MRETTLAELLKAGAHFGHQVSKWNPKMRPFIFAARNGIYIVDLEKTKERLEAACAFAEDIAARGGTVLFIGTKRQAKPIIEREAKRVGMPFVTNRWIGGTFTNYPTVSKLISKFKRLLGERERGELQKYIKKERLKIDEEIERLESLVGGMSDVAKLPDAVFMIDIKQERTALREAKKMNIPIIAVTDTNVNPTEVTYPIPGNDDATKAIELFVTALADAIESGAARAEKKSKDDVEPIQDAVIEEVPVVVPEIAIEELSETPIK